MVYRNGRFGRYLHCPDCKINKPIAEKAGICPDCGKDVLKRKSKTGKLFYGCSGYPDCKFISWDMPHGKCPQCDSYTVVKFSKVKNLIKCSNKECNYEAPYEKPDEN